MDAPTDDDLIPPANLLFDGSSTQEEFVATGEGFSRVYLVTRAQLKSHERVLDLGSGNGQKARVLTRLLDPKRGSYEGLDIVREGVEWCQKVYARFPNFRFVLADDLYSSHYNPSGQIQAHEYSLPYEDGEFDLVFCASLFTHLLPHETANYVNEIARVLKPGGRLVLTAFILSSDTLKNSTRGFIKFPVDRNGYRIADGDNPSWAVALPEQLLRDTITGAGLRICEVTYGTWNGDTDMLHALQDCVISVKQTDPQT